MCNINFIRVLAFDYVPTFVLSSIFRFMIYLCYLSLFTDTGVQCHFHLSFTGITTIGQELLILSRVQTRFFLSGVRVAFYGRHNGLTVTEYLLQTTRIIALRYRSYNPVLLSSFMTYHRICNTNYARVATSATGTANLSGVPEINPFFSDNCMFVCPFIFCHWIVCSS